MKNLLLIALLMACCGGLSAQASPLAAPAEVAGLELDGFVLDQTRTRAGREFYEHFFAQWTAAAASTGGANILLEEQPSRGRFGYLEIKVDDTVVAAYHLQPKEEWREAVVQQAIARLRQFFDRQSQLQLDLNDQDLTGSGIY